MINYDSILSAFDGKPTLLQWLKMVKKALDESILKNVDITQNGEKVVFSFNFEDGTSISTPELTLPKGDKGDKGEQTDVQQTTGQSTTAVMSQKATTDEITTLKGDLNELGNNVARDIGYLGVWNDNQYVPYSDGRQWTYLDGWSWSRYKVDSGHSYFINKEAHVCFYTSYNLSSYVSGALPNRIGNTDRYITVPNNCIYMVVSVKSSEKDTLSIIDKKWSDSLTIKKVYEVGTRREFATILSALEHIRTNNVYNADVLIDEGVYDFINEIKTVKGSNYISTYSASDEFKGYFLGKGISIKGRGNVTINCDYTRTGSNDNFAEYVSVFHIYDNTFRLENVNVNAKGCRYIIHDDSHNKYSSLDQIGEITHCHFVDNGVDRGAIIGGGLFSNDVRLIHDCDFIVSDGVNHNVGVSYHTNSDSDVCTVRITNCYCEGCTFGIIASGSPTGLATMYVSNSKVSVAPYETGTGNIKIISWNNEVG